MVKRNSHFTQVAPTYLFQEVGRRVKTFTLSNPSARLVSLSIGDTSEPIVKEIAEAMEQESQRLGSIEGYRGYGPEQGDQRLREQIAKVIYKEKLQPDEIFISDGAKCDIGRLQTLFGPKTTVAVQDPTYPVYADTSRLIGQPPLFHLPDDAKKLPDADVLYLCSPNNPTGAVLTHQELTTFVKWARQNKSVIVFDASYAAYIQDPSLPRSIYEIEHAEEVAIETSSFSKLAGFTGVRLGWTVIPHALRYEDGYSLHADWSRLVTTFFNGASSISQAGGLAALSEKGLQAIHAQISFYLENAKLIRQALIAKGCHVIGGENAPYLWIDFENGLSSWDLFQCLLEKTHLVTTPGSGFGSCGEGCLRLSAFGSRKHILESVKHIEERWPKNM